MDSAEQVKDIAAKWLARRASESWSAADDAELTQWLDASTGHLIAFMRLEAAWKEADRLKVLGAGMERGTVPSLEDFRRSPFFRHVSQQMPAATEVSAAAEVSDARPRKPLRWIAAAASILIVVFASVWLTDTFSSRGYSTYSTSIGVTAAVPLPDGSKVTLNTGSEIRVAVTETERHVDLEQGEAFFEVFPDATRPFVVRAGDKRFVAVGTKFSVRRDHDDVRLIVTEGKVRIEPARAGSPAPSAQVSAGSVARAVDGNVAVQTRTLPEAEELLSWRSGYLVFHETPLADAVAEFNRYNKRRIVIEDPHVAGMTISGNFRATNVDSFTRLLEGGFPISVERQDDRIVLTQR